MITRPLTRTRNWVHDTTHTNAARVTWTRSTAEYILGIVISVRNGERTFYALLARRSLLPAAQHSLAPYSFAVHFVSRRKCMGLVFVLDWVQCVRVQRTHFTVVLVYTQQADKFKKSNVYWTVHHYHS